MSQYHKIAKQRFYEEISEELIPWFIEEHLTKYEMLMKTARTVWEREVAKILTKRYNDFAITVKK